MGDAPPIDAAGSSCRPIHAARCIGYTLLTLICAPMFLVLLVPLLPPLLIMLRRPPRKRWTPPPETVAHKEARVNAVATCRSAEAVAERAPLLTSKAKAGVIQARLGE
mmetsp:Transcript_69316/g.115210  ORF Transcript_69316/g.115210 Transcript_69316/m.115210 type:complete len:108 (-) Transcript_69316:103-426(-)